MCDHQSELMRFDPAYGTPEPYPSHAEQWREYHGYKCAWVYNPWTGDMRDPKDIGSDVLGRAILPPKRGQPSAGGSRSE